MPRGKQPKVYPAELVEQVERLYAEDRTQAEIASQLGLTQKIVWNLMRRHGIQARVAAKRDQRGSRNHAWKGDAANYQAMHLRVASRRGQPKRCQRCGTSDPARTYDWANLSGRYEDPEDYERMCRHCHRRYDLERAARG